MNHLSTQTQWWNLINNICEQYLKWFLTFDMSNNNSNNWCLASGMQLRRWGYPLHIGLASLMLLTLDLQRHSAKRTGDVNVMPPLGLEKFCSAPSCGTEHWIYPIGVDGSFSQRWLLPDPVQVGSFRWTVKPYRIDTKYCLLPRSGFYPRNLRILISYSVINGMLAFAPWCGVSCLLFLNSLKKARSQNTRITGHHVTPIAFF